MSARHITVSTVGLVPRMRQLAEEGIPVTLGNTFLEVGIHDGPLEREVVDALVSSVQAAYPRLSHRYYALKARWLGMDQMNHWDRNAPLPETPQATIGWRPSSSCDVPCRRSGHVTVAKPPSSRTQRAELACSSVSE